MRQYEMYEITSMGRKLNNDQVKIALSVTVSVGDERKILKAFYDGENEAGKGVYKVRIYPEKAGLYVIKTEKNEYGVSMDETVVCEKKDAESIHHGMVQAYETHFRYADGTWFYPFGTTVYAMAHQPEAVIEQTFDTLGRNPFNKVRMCIFPKHYDFNNNEPEFFPFRQKEDGSFDENQPDAEFWRRMDKLIERLNAMGGTLIGESPARIRFLKEIIEQMPGPLSYCGRYMNEAKFNDYRKLVKPEEAPNDLIKLMLKLPWEKAQFLAMSGREYESSYEEQVYLKYYARHCTSVGTLKLPENKKYKVEMIDVWKMIRTTLLEDASGAVEVKLPGKEGIALLATMTEE